MAGRRLNDCLKFRPRLVVGLRRDQQQITCHFADPAFFRLGARAFGKVLDDGPRPINAAEFLGRPSPAARDQPLRSRG